MQLRALAFAVLATLAGTAGISAAERVALVIGNADYEKVGRLVNPGNDATDLAAALERIGFEATLVIDADFSEMHRALRDFSTEAQNAEVALIYFAGHGIEIDKQNYLIPTDAELSTDRQVRLETVSLDLMNEAVSGASTLRMVLVDACRNNPFLNQMVVAEAGRSLGRGLSPMEPVGGTLVAFAAKGGTVALDGSGRNSPYMTGLLKFIEQPGLDVSLMFRKVRDSVLEATREKQEPFTYGSLPGEELYLVPPVEIAKTVQPEAPEAPKTAVATPEDVPQPARPDEELAWSLVKDTTDARALQTFIRLFPDGVHSDEAFQRLAALDDDAKVEIEDVPVVVVPKAPEEAVVKREEAVVEPEEALVEPVPAVDPEVERAAQERELTIALQTELARAGCRPGSADGIWGPRSRQALTTFARDAKVTFDGTNPTPETLALVQGTTGVVCVIVDPPVVRKKRVAAPKEEVEVEERPKRRAEEPVFSSNESAVCLSKGDGGISRC